jgi:hydrogenase maturation protein HypF
VAACTDLGRSVLARQLETGLNSLPTSSMGRLFDSMSSLTGTCHRIAYEAEAAMRFEGLARQAIEGSGPGYGFTLDTTGSMIIADPMPVLAPLRRTCSAAPRRRSSPRVSITRWPTWWPTWHSPSGTRP